MPAVMSSRGRPRRHRARPDLDDEVIRRAYVDQRLSLAQVGELTGLTLSTVCRRLKDMGVPRRRIGGAILDCPDPYQDLAPVLTAKLLRRLYLDQRLTPLEIGRRTGCSSTSVTKYLRMAGIPLRPSSLPKYRLNPTELAKLRAKGWTTTRIAARYGCSDDTVERALRTAGLPTRLAKYAPPGPQRQRG